MSWPPSSDLTNNFYQNKKGTGGVVTAAWGTDGVYTGAIVKTLRPARDGENIPIEQGSGLVANMIQLLQGNRFEITFEDDRNVNFPDFGANLTLLFNPLDNFASSANVSSIACLVLDNSYNMARKANGERVILCERFTSGIP